MDERPPRRFYGGALFAVGRSWLLGSVVGWPLARLTIADDSVLLTPVVPHLFRVRVVPRELVERLGSGRLGGVRVDASALRLGGFIFRPWGGSKAEVLREFHDRGYAVT